MSFFRAAAASSRRPTFGTQRQGCRPIAAAGLYAVDSDAQPATSFVSRGLYGRMERGGRIRLGV